MGKNIKKRLLAGLGLTSLGVLGKTIYDYYRENPTQSKQSWLLERFFKLITWPFNKVESKSVFNKSVTFLDQLNDGFVKVPHFNTIEVSEWLVQDMQTIVLNDKKDLEQDVIFFLHGGAYIIQATPFYFYTIADIIRQTDAKVVMPIYPKAPKHDFIEAYPRVLKAYRQVLEQTVSPDKISFFRGYCRWRFCSWIKSFTDTRKSTTTKTTNFTFPLAGCKFQKPRHAKI